MCKKIQTKKRQPAKETSDSDVSTHTTKKEFDKSKQKAKQNCIHQADNPEMQ